MNHNEHPFHSFMSEFHNTKEGMIAWIEKAIIEGEIKLEKTQEYSQSEETDENWHLVVTLAQINLEADRICLLLLTQTLKTKRLAELVLEKMNKNFELRQEILDEMVSLDMIDENTYINYVNSNMSKRNMFDTVKAHYL